MEEMSEFLSWVKRERPNLLDALYKEFEEWKESKGELHGKKNI